VTAERHSPQVLVVEDDEDLRVALSMLFSASGYDVGIATNGAEAMEWLEQHRPCAVILDLLMPGIVGQELLELMRSERALSSIPVAIVSGSPELAPPGYRVFRKPVDHIALVEFVRASCLRCAENRR
jgi:CheY-like chemotaxis protein